MAPSSDSSDPRPTVRSDSARNVPAVPVACPECGSTSYGFDPDTDAPVCGGCGAVLAEDLDDERSWVLAGVLARIGPRLEQHLAAVPQ